jgi:hypothetical protein
MYGVWRGEYHIPMLKEKIGEKSRHIQSSMRDCLLQSRSGKVAMSRIQGAVSQERCYFFYPDKQVISALGLGSSIGSMNGRLLRIQIGMYHDLHGAALKSIEQQVPKHVANLIHYAISLIHQVLAEIEGYVTGEERFVLVREIPEAPVFHHLVLRCVPAKGQEEALAALDGPSLYFGLLLFDAIHRRIAWGDEESYRALKELILLEQKAIRTGYVPCETLNALVSSLVEESIFLYEQQPKELFSAVV